MFKISCAISRPVVIMYRLKIFCCLKDVSFLVNFWCLFRWIVYTIEINLKLACAALISVITLLYSFPPRLSLVTELSHLQRGKQQSLKRSKNFVWTLISFYLVDKCLDGPFHWKSFCKIEQNKKAVVFRANFHIARTDTERRTEL